MKHLFGDGWLMADAFFAADNEYRHGELNRENFDAMCAKYDVAKVAGYWVQPKDLDELPAVWKEKINEKAPDIRGYFDHFYSIQTKDGEIFWVVCPYDRGMAMLEVMRAFRANHIICDVMPGFYADYTIIMRPNDLVEACYSYAIIEQKGGHNPWLLMKVSNVLEEKALMYYPQYYHAELVAAGANDAIKRFFHN